MADDIVIWGCKDKDGRVCVLGDEDPVSHQCSLCAKWWHPRCLKWNSNQRSRFKKQIKKKIWTCQDCPIHPDLLPKRTGLRRLKDFPNSQPVATPFSQALPSSSQIAPGPLSRGNLVPVASQIASTSQISRNLRGKQKKIDSSTLHQSNHPSNVFLEVSNVDELVSHLKKYSQSRPVLKRIPKYARPTVAEDLAKTIMNAATKNDFQSWAKLFTFVYKYLHIPFNSSTSKLSLATLVKRNFDPNYQEPPPPQPKHRRSRKNKSKPPDSELSKRVEAKISDFNIGGALRMLCSEDSVVSPSEESYQALLKKHPRAPNDLKLPEAPSLLNDLPNVTLEEVKAAIKSFPRGSSGGLDGIRPQHLLDLIGDELGTASRNLLESLVALSELMLSGKVLKDICPILYGGRLIGLTKKDGGIRPIAVGSTLRRLVAKIIGSRVKDEMVDLLTPTQVGYGVKGGAEAAVHSVREFWTSDDPTPKVIAKLDYINAFNELRRDEMLEESNEHLPLYYPFIWQCYGEASILVHGDFIIKSESGVQQGDPLGGILFSLTLRKVTKKLIAVLKVLFFDDATLGGSPDDILADLERVIHDSRIVGLKLNFAKCEIFAKNLSDDDVATFKMKLQRLCPGMKYPKTSDFFLLGSPVTEEAISGAIEEKIQTMSLMSERLKLIDSHPALFLLKNCMGMPKLLHLLRSSPAWKFPSQLIKFDEVLKSSLESILNIALDPKSWRQASLPVKMGGLGIRRTEEISIPAFISSSIANADLVKRILPTSSDVENLVLIDAITNWRRFTTLDVPSGDKAKLQKIWDLPITLKARDELISNPTNSERDTAHLRGVCVKESGHFLDSIPVSSLGNRLNNESLRVIICYRLAVPIFSKIGHWNCTRCGVEMEHYGDHGLRCLKSISRHDRHTNGNVNIQRALASCGIPSRLEPPGIFRKAGKGGYKRVDGASLVPFKAGKTLLFDFTAVDPLCKSYIRKSASTPGSACIGAEEKKRDRYSELNPAIYDFYPVAFDTLGACGPDAKSLINQLGDKIKSIFYPTFRILECIILAISYSSSVHRFTHSCPFNPGHVISG